MSTEGATSRLIKLGRYELITRIGQGGMAEVQLALQRGPAGFEKLVVVKLVHENLATQKAFVDMLLDEARVAALVKHPNVVDIYDLGEVDGRYFIAMEYLEGEPLLSVLRAGREGKRLDVMSTARLVADTAEGLEAAHELRSMAGEPLELVHHDVSLGNIVVLYNGQVKLVDFGVAKATQSATNDRKVQGKFSYMAPEKLKGANGDRRSDIWSLGVVLWESLTLKRLFRGGNESDTMRQVLEMPLLPPSEVNGDVPVAFDEVAMRALQRDPDSRYATAKAMADDLENILTDARYGAKNDAIGRYMQETFKQHITARKKLLQEVSSKGMASTEILDLAFSEPLIASGSSPGQNDFSVRFRRSSIDVPTRSESSELTLLPVTDVAVSRTPTPTPLPRRSNSAIPLDLEAQTISTSREPIDRTAPPFGGADREGSLAIEAILAAAVAAVDATPIPKRPIARGSSEPMTPTPESIAEIELARQTPPHLQFDEISHAGARPLTDGALEDRVLADSQPPHDAELDNPLVAARGLAEDSGARSRPSSTPPDSISVTSPRLEIKKRRTEPKMDVVTALPESESRLSRIVVIVVVALIGIAIGVFFVMRGGGGSSDDDAPKHAPAPAPPPPHASAPVPLPAAGVIAAPEGSAAPTTAPAGSDAAPKPDDAETLYRQGVRQLTSGATKEALESFKRSQLALPDFAPTQRGLGLSYEKLGDKPAARLAFQRYLQLAPSAADAPLIRAKLDGL